MPAFNLKMAIAVLTETENLQHLMQLIPKCQIYALNYRYLKPKTRILSHGFLNNKKC
jgi:hypothetical protein